MDVRTVLLQLRTELNMRQVDLANELGVSPITLNRWENGKNAPSRAMSLAIIAVAGAQGASAVCRNALTEVLLEPSKEPRLDSLKFASVDQINNLVNDSSNAVYVCDAKTRELLYVNRKLCDSVHKTAEEAEGKRCHEFIFDETSPCAFCSFRQPDDGRFSTCEFESPKTGCYYMMRHKLITWNGRKAYITYATDITEFYAVRKQLARSQALMATACAHAQMWAFMLDIQAGSVHMEPAVQRIVGLPTVMRKPLDELLRIGAISADDAKALEKTFAELKGEKDTVEIVVRTGFLDTKPHWVRLRGHTAEYDENGTPVTAICSAQVVDNEMALRERIRFEHEQIVDNHKDLMGYVISNLTTNVVVESRRIFPNGPIAQINVPYDAAVEKAITGVEPAEDKARFAQMHDRQTLLAQFLKGNLEKNFDYQLRQSDGSLMWVHDQMKLMLNPGSEDVMLYEYCFDAHAEKIMERLLCDSFGNGYDTMGAVSLLNDQATRLCFSQAGTIETQRLKYGAYTKELEIYCRQSVLPEERQRFLQALSIETLCERLKEKNVYRVSYRALASDGTPRTKIAQYTLYDKTRKFCIMSILDPEKFMASVNDVN